MSVQAISWALSVKAGSPSAKCVLLCIANYADARGRCWPAQSTIADQSEQSTDTVQRRIVELEDLGLLTRTERPDQNGKPGGKFFYQLAMGETERIGTSADESGRIGTMPQVAASPTTPQKTANHAAKEANHAAKTLKPCRTVAALTATLNPSLNPSLLNPSLNEKFDLFWQSYPRRIGKQAAVKAFAKAMASGKVDFTALLASVDRFRAWAATKEIQYVKHPATWLNAGCWDDELTRGEFSNGNTKSVTAAVARLRESGFRLNPRPGLLPTGQSESNFQLIPKG